MVGPLQAIAVGRGLLKVMPLTWITRAAASAMLILAGATPFGCGTITL